MKLKGVFIGWVVCVALGGLLPLRTLAATTAATTEIATEAAIETTTETATEMTSATTTKAAVGTTTETAEEDGLGEYRLVFSDEFDLPDGSAPDSTKWGPCPREGATWSRWISASPEVAFIQDGALVCRAIPNPNRGKGSAPMTKSSSSMIKDADPMTRGSSSMIKDTDPMIGGSSSMIKGSAPMSGGSASMIRDAAPMLTGAVHTKNRFSFQYGKVEVRLKTNLHAGNFPAAWMMPQPPAKGWPYGGEIDIFESIDTVNRAYHTIHSHWTYHLGNGSNPQHGFNEEMTVAEWHVYGLEWTDSLVTWTVDGVVTGTYAKSSDPKALEQGQWPYDHPFYLILNQSVGDGSWAAKADTSYTYTTWFDYVRVYQRTDAASQTERGSKTSRRRIWSWLPWNW